MDMVIIKCGTFSLVRITSLVFAAHIFFLISFTSISGLIAGTKGLYTIAMSGSCKELRKKVPEYILVNGLLPKINGHEEAMNRLRNMLICRSDYLEDDSLSNVICVISLWLLKDRYTIEVVCYPVVDLQLNPYYCFEDESIYECVKRFRLDYMYKFIVSFYIKTGEFKIQESIYGSLNSFIRELELKEIRDSLQMLRRRIDDALKRR